MLFLLPPSETKSRPADGDALDLSSLAFPELTDARTMMLEAVRETANHSKAAELLGVPASQPELVTRMAALDEEPSAPPLEVYSGVLFEILAGMTPHPDRPILIQSALLGLVDAAHDRIPAYRVSATSRIEGLGKAGTWWKQQLRTLASQLMQAQAQSDSPVVIDCRSGAYRTMMPLPQDPSVHVLEVGAVQDLRGRRTVISHNAKRYRGWVARALSEAPTAPREPAEVVEILRSSLDHSLDVELDGTQLTIVDHPDRDGAP